MLVTSVPKAQAVRAKKGDRKSEDLSPSSFLLATEMRGSLRNNPSVLVLPQQEVNNKYYMY